MTYICRKWLKNFLKRVKYVGNDVEMWELAKYLRKWVKYLRNGLNVWEMT